MKPLQLIKAIKFQIKSDEAFIQIFIKRNAWGILSKFSHYTKEGKLKQKYNREESALEASEKMQTKYGGVFKHYKCAFCDVYHIGKPLKK